MVPRIEIMDALPLLPSGKIDRRALMDQPLRVRNSAMVAPRDHFEEQVCQAFKDVLHVEQVSVQAHFFNELGGDSMRALSVLEAVNARLHSELPNRALHDYPTAAGLAARVRRGYGSVSRLSRLVEGAGGAPTWLFPGLGGSPDRLAPLARCLGREAYGIVSQGLDPGSRPQQDLSLAAAADIDLIRSIQPTGPYCLIGYSAGTVGAVEVAWQLEQAGEVVEVLGLIAPGSPKVIGATCRGSARRADFDDPAFVAVLFSVFSGRLTHPELGPCLAQSKSRAAFVRFVSRAFDLRPAVTERIVDVASVTYGLCPSNEYLRARKLRGPVVAFPAAGDEPSFVDRWDQPVVVQPLRVGHYDALTDAVSLRTVARRLLTISQSR